MEKPLLYSQKVLQISGKLQSIELQTLSTSSNTTSSTTSTSTTSPSTSPIGPHIGSPLKTYSPPLALVSTRATDIRSSTQAKTHSNMLCTPGFAATPALLPQQAKQTSFTSSRPLGYFGGTTVAPRARRAARWTMMPIGVPKVLFRVPGAPQADWVDIYNRLYRERIIFLGQEIDDEIANQIIAVMLYLESEDNTKPIYLYINSPGGSVIAGMAIYDTMKHIKSDVVTINVGLAASMASFLLGGGEKGKRLALPHSRVMIHQPMGGAQGQASDIEVEALQILRIRENLTHEYARMTGQKYEALLEDMDRDNFMSAQEALEYGLVDRVIEGTSQAV